MADQSAVLPAVLDRLFAANGKGRLEALLRAIKDTQKAPKSAFRTTGAQSDLAEGVREAIDGGYLTLDRLAAVVDELEENGAQHIFLFTLTEAGKANLSAKRLGDAYPAPPKSPTAAMYAEQPTRRTVFEDRSGGLVLKQLSVGEFWEVDENESKETADLRVRVWNRERKRAINLLRVRRSTGEAEIRIGRARNRDDTPLALELLAAFVSSISDVIDVPRDLRPLPVWLGYRAMIGQKEETYMSTDDGYDASVRMRVANRRAGTRGTDVRDHASFALRSSHTRDTLNLYWRIPARIADNPKAMLHTIMSRLRMKTPPTDYAKVYVAAHTSAQELDHVLGRIRNLTPSSS